MSAPVTVYYNGSCPICRTEIAHYRKVAGRHEAGFGFVDISAEPEALAAWGADAQAVRRQLHVVDGDGRLRIGVPAFVAIWTRLPGYGWLGRLVARPGMQGLATRFYGVLARLLYWADRRRQTRAAADGTDPR